MPSNLGGRPRTEYRPVGRPKATHCIAGHAYTPENTYVFNGRQHCRICRRHHTKTWVQRQGKERKRAREQAWRSDPKNRDKLYVMRKRQQVKALYGLTLEAYEAIRMLCDDPQRARAAADYLERHQGGQ